MSYVGLIENITAKSKDEYHVTILISFVSDDFSSCISEVIRFVSNKKQVDLRPTHSQ